MNYIKIQEMFILLYRDPLREIHAGVYICHISLACIPCPPCILSLMYTNQTPSFTDARRHTHTHAEVQDYLVFRECISEVSLRNSLLAKPLNSRPLAVQLVKMWCDLKAHSSFCLLQKDTMGVG